MPLRDDVVAAEDGSIEVTCPPGDYAAVKAGLEKAGLKAEHSEVTMKPATEMALSGEDAAKLQRMLDALEALDDVQHVYTTAALDAG